MPRPALSALPLVTAGLLAAGCLPSNVPPTSAGNGSAGASGSGSSSGSTGGSNGSTGGSNGSAGSGGAGDSAPPDMALAGVPFVYVGGYAAQISVYRLDEQTGKLTAGTPLAYGSAPSFLAADPRHQFLYAVDEYASKVAAFAIDQKSGALTHVGNDVASGGSGPVHLTVDRGGKFVLVANYTSGQAATFPIAANGALGAQAGSAAPGQLAHLIVLDPGNQYAFVPCLMSNYVAQLVFDGASGKLTANSPATVGPALPAAASPSGPRHLAFHPSGKWAYLVNETASTVTVYGYDGASGKLSALQTLSALKAPVAGNTGAEIVVAPSGRFVYSSNRGDESIAVFAVDAAGKLSLVTTVKTGGATPRSFTVDPTGQWLLAANQGGNSLTVLRIDAASGVPAAVGAPVSVSQPAFVGVVTLPGG